MKMKKIKVVIGIIFLTVVCIGFYFIIGIKNYIYKSPVITSKEPILVQVGDTITINELVDIEKSVESKILPILEGYTNGGNYGSRVQVSEDGQSVFVGNEKCEFVVTIYAVGENSERREKKITVKVTDSK